MYSKNIVPFIAHHHHCLWLCVCIFFILILFFFFLILRTFIVNFVISTLLWLLCTWFRGVFNHRLCGFILFCINNNRWALKSKLARFFFFSFLGISMGIYFYFLVLYHATCSSPYIHTYNDKYTHTYIHIYNNYWRGWVMIFRVVLSGLKWLFYMETVESCWCTCKSPGGFCFICVWPVLKSSIYINIHWGAFVCDSLLERTEWYQPTFVVRES